MVWVFCGGEWDFCGIFLGDFGDGFIEGGRRELGQRKRPVTARKTGLL